MTSELYVHLYPPGETNSKAVGKLVYKEGFYTFVYGQRYLESDTAFPLDPLHLPLSDRLYTERGLFHSLGILRDASPDMWGRRVLATMQQQAVLSDLDYLLYSAGQHRVGALEFSTTPAAMDKAVIFTELAGILYASQALEAGEELPEELKLALQGGSSMGGARPKAVLYHDDLLWLAKFPSKTDRINLPQLEHDTLKLAQACGITVAESKLVEVENTPVLLVKRFDRRRQGNDWLHVSTISAG